MPVGRTVRSAYVAAAVVLLAACGSGDPCSKPVEDGSCADLLFSGREYDEWRPVPLSTTDQEVGDATYPTCNDDEPCSGPDLNGFGATDVWLWKGVDPRRAVIGLRQGTKTSVVFVRRGVDRASLPGG